jgi:hypothetical protein
MAKEQSVASAAQARRSFEQIFPASLLPAHHFEPVVYAGSIRWAVLLGLEFCIVPIGAADEKKVRKSQRIIFSSAAVGAGAREGAGCRPAGVDTERFSCQDSTVRYLHEVRLPAVCVRACTQVLRCQIRDITKLEINREEHFQFSDDKVQRKLLKSRTHFHFKRRRDPHTHMRCVCGLCDTPVCLMCVRVRGVLCVLCLCVYVYVCVCVWCATQQTQRTAQVTVVLEESVSGARTSSGGSSPLMRIFGSSSRYFFF